MPRHVDPRRCTIALDAHVLERADLTGRRLADRFQALSEAGAIRVLTVNRSRHVLSSIPGAGVQKVQTTVRDVLLGLIKGRIERNESIPDASSLFDPLETVSSYFITDDPTLLNDPERDTSAILVVTLEEFIAIYQAWVDWNS